MVDIPWAVDSQAGSFALPFLFTATIGIIIWICNYRWLPGSNRSQQRSALGENAPDLVRRKFLPFLLILTLLVAAGLGSFEVGLALQGKLLRLTPFRISLMFMECGLIMIAVQLLIFDLLTKMVNTYLIVALTLLAMASGLWFLPKTSGFGTMLFLVGLVSASSGILTPFLSYRISQNAGTAQGETLGKQTSMASMGQAIGSIMAGMLFDANMATSFRLMAVLILTAAIASVGIERMLRTA